jgi:hypothetical protein
MILASELRRKTIERVSSVSVARQEDERPTVTSPIKHFKPDTLLDGDEPDLVR